MEFVMSEVLNFPIKYEYARVTSGDYVTNGSSDFTYMYYKSKNRAINVLADTSKVTDTSNMFDGCNLLEAVYQFDTSSVTVMSNMFNDCGSLYYIPLLDTSNVTMTPYMFSGCSSLRTIPQLNTSNVTVMSNMFGGCGRLTSIPLLDCGKVGNVNNFFGSNNVLTKLEHLGGFKDLGKKSSISGINNGFLERTPNLTRESLMNVIENLYDRKSNGLSNTSIKFGTTNLAKLTDEEKAIAINKGWNLS